MADSANVKQERNRITDDQHPVVSLHIGIVRSEGKDSRHDRCRYEFGIYRHHKDDVQKSLAEYYVGKNTGVYESNTRVIERNILIAPYAYENGDINAEQYRLEPRDHLDPAVFEYEQHRHRHDKRSSEILEPYSYHDLVKIVAHHFKKIAGILYKNAQTNYQQQLRDFRSLLDEEHRCAGKAYHYRYDL